MRSTVTNDCTLHVAAAVTTLPTAAVAGGGDGDPDGGGSALAGGRTAMYGDAGDAQISTDAGIYIDSSANASKNAVQQSSSVLTSAVVKAVFGGEDIAALYATAVLESQQLLKDADAHFKTTISWRAAIIEAAAPNNAFNNAIDSSKVLSAKAFEYLQQAIQLVKLVAEEAVAGVVAFRVVPAYADLIATSQQLVRGVNAELGRMQQSLIEAGNRRGEG